MKNYVQFLLLLTLGFAAFARVSPRNKFEDGLLKVIEKCKEGDIESLPVPLPSLKSLRIPSMKINYDGYTMYLDGINMKGLEYLTVHKLSASPPDMTLSMEMFIPTVAVRANRYHLLGKAMWFFNIDDKGIFKSTINKIKVQVDVQLGAEGKNTVITDVNVNYSLGGITINLSGSTGIVNRRVKDKILKLIKRNETTERIQNLIKEIAREYLRGHTPQEFIEIISAI